MISSLQVWLELFVVAFLCASSDRPLLNQVKCKAAAPCSQPSHKALVLLRRTLEAQ